MQCKMYKDQTHKNCHVTKLLIVAQSHLKISSDPTRNQAELWLSGCLTSFDIGFQLSNQLDYS